MAEDGKKSGSLFTVGDNVELWRLLTFLSLLVAFVLMVLGLVGLVLKIYKEIMHPDAYSKRMIAFQAADLTVDKAELVSSEHLLDIIRKSASPAQPPVASAPKPKGSFLSRFSSLALVKEATHSGVRATRIRESDFPELIRMRILRHFFLRTYKLPELFPFSKYLRQAQDNQITHMIEVEMSTWIVLLAIAWGLAGLTCFFEHEYDIAERRAIVYAFLVFSWLSVLLHVFVLAYMRWAVEQLLSAAGEHFGRTTQLKCLKAVAEHETRTVSEESVADAIATMESVRETERQKKGKRHRRHLTQHDTGFQLLATIGRHVAAALRRQQPTQRDGDGDSAAGLAEAGAARRTSSSAAVAAVSLKWFSRKAWHFFVMSLLMLNGFYVALFFQCVLYELILDAFDVLLVALAPVPFVANMLFFQSRILRNFVLVSCVSRVDDAALGDVIDHFTETVALRAELVASVSAYLQAHGLAVADLDAAFVALDPDRTGVLELEDVRRVLERFGFALSYFRFNSVAALLFRLRGTGVEYAQVSKLLLFARRDAGVRALIATEAPGGGDDSELSGETDDFDVSVGPQSTMMSSRRAPALARSASATGARALYRLDFREVEIEL
ncbi:hypothetical protein PybrP1_003284 [[Pythium] brassicae (nom. inval.)]|nr:hypothetical protein PybrP1_003284 [[Pythium] brassicae (nom. inval.)]